MARPILSVILSAKNEAEHVKACFDSLGQQRTRYPFEVLFVDNGSRDETFRLATRLAKEHKNFHLFRERKPGCAAALNHGARRARGQILVFAHVDCRPARNWLQEIAKPLLSQAEYPLAAVSGRTVIEHGAQETPNLVERYLDEACAFWEKDRLADFPTFLPWAPGYNLAVKREIFHALGGFDTRWKNAAYDLDFCWRLALCGFMLGYAPRAEMKRVHRSSLRSVLRQMESSAFHSQALLATYEKILAVPTVKPRPKRLLDRSRRALGRIGATTDFRQASFRGLDLLSVLFGVKGALESRFLRAEPDRRFRATRQGRTPPALEKYLPPGYQHLHREGWAYWKAPRSVDERGDLVLFSPRRGERFRLSSTSWKIWDVKSRRGQSEDAALALGHHAHDEKILHDIDERTLELRTRRLLP